MENLTYTISEYGLLYKRLHAFSTVYFFRRQSIYKPAS